MSETAIALIVDWVGPFDTVEGASNSAGDDEIIYLAIGKTARKHRKLLQYVGIANVGNQRLTVGHHRLGEIERELELWIGFIASHSKAGRRGVKDPKKHRVELELAESGLAYFLQLPLNIQKRKTVPRYSFVILNRWFKKDKTRWKKRAHPDWPNLLEYDDAGDTPSAAKVWFGAPSKVRRLSADEIDALARNSN